eukprot:CAMPEP_0170551340 /NCGR_PEP_ID=MMETSP0211-20121228/9351_1 /TAXON_ID=311385 /ORGANISM="Pseudokeronopsis sp., Strain OXSARD2" /LENGTH=77 /DNA_ID=CAMNT_0010858443 /DNA_START=127 /DNA_END=360 /DNA_ORIENTATION=-
MQKAYAYLTNPTTRIIYDNYGCTGLKVYEHFQEDFREISEGLRDQDLDEEKKKELKEALINKSKRMVDSFLRNQIHM